MNIIKVFKMINGEELIAEVKLDNSETYELINPATIQLQQTSQGVGVGIAPYMPYAGEEIVLRKAAIAAEGNPEEKMQNEYRRIFSGIEIAPASALAGLSIVK